MKNLLLLIAPALTILAMMVGVFTLVGYGYDWPFTIGATLVTLLVSMVEMGAEWLAKRPLPTR